MLVIASDIHLSDETVGVVVSDKTFSLFASRLRELAYQASWRAGGRYYPVREIDILLLGDVLDPLQSTRWLEEAPGQADYVRPWHDPQSAQFIHKVREITRAILQKNQHAVDVLKKLSNAEGVRLPPADRRGNPDLYTQERVTPVVRIHYMVGNHDWFYHLPGAEYDAIRAEIIEALGLSNPPGPFPHGPETAGDSLTDSLSRYRLVARHGDLFDPMSYNPDLGRNASSLSDIYCSEVIYRFPYEVSRQLGSELPPKLLRGIQRLTNVRPLLATPLWIVDQVHRHGTDQASIRQIKQIWDMVIDDFLALEVLQTNQFTNPRTRNTLKLVFGISKKMSLPAIAGMSRLLRNHVGEEHISIARFARQEANIRSGQADVAIYGHTHSHEIVPLDKRARKDPESGQVYINTGAWATFFDYSQQHKTDQKTVPMHLLTCVALYREGERQGRRHETWWANFA